MKTGDIVLEEEPYCHVLLQSQRGLRCDRCLSSQQDLKKCTGCKLVFYCDRTCQKRDWTVHKKECRCLKAISPKVPVDSVRLVLRLIITLDLDLPMNSPFSRKFEDLMTHEDEIKSDQTRSEQFAQVVFTLKEYAADIVVLPSATAIFEIFCKMMINSFTICDEVLDHLGTGIYLSGSIFDHSCRPNAVVTFLGNTLVVRAIDDIAGSSPDKVHISYIEQLHTTEDRQQQLEEQYYFTCQCGKCTDDSLNIEMKSIRCPSCKKPVELIKDNVECTKCGTVSKSHLDKVSEVIQKSMEFLDIPESKLTEDPKRTLDTCQSLITDLEKTVPVTNIYHVRVLDKALLAAIDMQDWDKALKYGCETLETYRKFYPGLSLNYALQLYKVGKLQLYKQELEEARKNLCESHSMLSRIYKQDMERSQTCSDLTTLIRQCEEEMRVKLENS